jgi:hypothetical protein
MALAALTIDSCRDPLYRPSEGDDRQKTRYVPHHLPPQEGLPSGAVGRKLEADVADHGEDQIGQGQSDDG